ncbi:hypothetical protein DCO58_11490 [Helicobacter saguini]|uniref:Uncharacterized protein n=1 Tax=Helicobacter saguini TaxID=1548018 RepID=A0A347VQ42_9HELI|nr:hypothetical protein [Helicobacter saguini]MWV61088.1 hypothetical protein [Helicobacter saguini]MWV68243.1 hypothetical protein [Helicobacter saguini]MWV70293.1 hypothetical protein [Helicobacter saguini]MWV72195.1 hypothetical protein [Helicobacter saguini]TLD95249.1 hypothetical protein LS64_002490 [Helicobacter saguini]
MKIFSNILAFLLCILATFGILNLSILNAQEKIVQEKSPKITESKIQIKGDTLIITDANCDSGRGNSLLDKLKDSKISKASDCDLSELGDKNPSKK